MARLDEIEERRRSLLLRFMGVAQRHGIFLVLMPSGCVFFTDQVIFTC